MHAVLTAPDPVAAFDLLIAEGEPLVIPVSPNFVFLTAFKTECIPEVPVAELGKSFYQAFIGSSDRKGQVVALQTYVLSRSALDRDILKARGGDDTKTTNKKYCTPLAAVHRYLVSASREKAHVFFCVSVKEGGEIYTVVAQWLGDPEDKSEKDGWSLYSSPLLDTHPWDPEQGTYLFVIPTVE